MRHIISAYIKLHFAEKSVSSNGKVFNNPNYTCRLLCLHCEGVTNMSTIHTDGKPAEADAGDSEGVE